MKVRSFAAVMALSGIVLFGAAKAGSTADASTTQLQTVTQTETIVSAKCYKTHKVTTTYYEYSKTKGWTKYAAPKKTTTDSETCKS
jgi:hypothetical protein